MFAWLVDLDLAEYASPALLLSILLFLGPFLMIAGLVLTIRICVASTRALLGKVPWTVHAQWFLPALLTSSTQTLGFFYPAGQILLRLFASIVA